jgi:hypothetical protein
MKNRQAWAHARARTHTHTEISDENKNMNYFVDLSLDERLILQWILSRNMVRIQLAEHWHGLSRIQYGSFQAALTWWWSWAGGSLSASQDRAYELEAVITVGQQTTHMFNHDNNTT